MGLKGVITAVVEVDSRVYEGVGVVVRNTANAEGTVEVSVTTSEVSPIPLGTRRYSKVGGKENEYRIFEFFAEKGTRYEVEIECCRGQGILYVSDNFTKTMDNEYQQLGPVQGLTHTVLPVQETSRELYLIFKSQGSKLEKDTEFYLSVFKS